MSPANSSRVLTSNISPETVILLRAIQPFELQYLSRSTSRLNEAVAAAFAGGSRSPPGASEGLTASRALSNELDSARFDPLLVKSVAKNVAKSVEMFVGRTEALVCFPFRNTGSLRTLLMLCKGCDGSLRNELAWTTQLAVSAHECGADECVVLSLATFTSHYDNRLRRCVWHSRYSATISWQSSVTALCHRFTATVGNQARILEYLGSNASRELR